MPETITASDLAQKSHFALNQAALVSMTDKNGQIEYVNDKFCQISKYNREALIGQNHRMVSSGYHTKAFIQNLWATISSGQVWHGELCNRAQDGSYYWVDATIVPFLDETGTPYQYMAIHFEITARKVIEMEAYRRATELETVARVNAAISSQLNIDDLLQSVADLTRERFQLYHVNIFLLDSQGEYLTLAAGSGELGRQMHDANVAIPIDHGKSIVARSARIQHGITVNDVYQEPDFQPNPLLPATCAQLVIPMIAGNRLIGVLDVQSDQMGRFNEEDILIKTMLAGQIAVAVQNARAFGEIREREQEVREALKQVENLRFALDQSAIVAITDQTGKIEFVNDKFCTISKYRHDELIGQDHRLINSGHHAKSYIRNMWVTIANGQVWRGDVCNRAKDGSIYWVDSTIIPLLNVEGKPRQYISIRHEITERKLAEEALARSETLYRTIVSTLAEGVLIQDRSARITTCNTSAERILGLTHNQIMGSTSLDLAWRCIHEDGSPFPGDTHPAMVALQTGQTQRNVIMGVYKPDDTLGWISINCEPLHREDETEPYGVVTSFTDITARKLTEEALRERDRLRIALDSEHELNAIKNRIMRTISHEFRTPLTVLNVASFRMTSHLDALTPEFIERQMGVIKNQVGRLTAMIEEISNVVRETFDAVGFQPQMTNLNLLAEFNLKDIESTIGASHQLIYRPDPQLDRVMVDERLMNRILINLLSNAVKYSRKDTAITLELRAEDNDAVIVISDQGIGIPPKAQEHLFEPFFRAENVGAINGTGMGLNIVRDCVKLHRGTIEVQSELNRGTEFTVRVPVRA